MDWKTCVICKKKTQENLNCPKKGVCSNAHIVYASFLENVEKFQKVDSLPVDVEYGSEGTVEAFMTNNASWHHSCHQKFNNTKLKRTLEGKRKRGPVEEEEEDAKEMRSTKRQQSPTDYKSICIFCEKNDNQKLHKFETLEADQSLKRIAGDMKDDRLLSKITGSDVIALEAKYHLHCLTRYRNKHRSHLREQGSSTKETKETEMRHARAFVELVSHIEAAVENGKYIFKLLDLHELYERRLHSLGHTVSMNRSRLKAKIINHFVETGVQEQTDGKNVLLVFPEGMQQLLKDALKGSDCQEDAFLFAKVAKICREEMFGKKHFTFSGSFPQNCQKMLPKLTLLCSMILYGSELKTPNDEDEDDSQECRTMAQLFLHNSKKKSPTLSAHSCKRHSQDGEPPLPIYIGLNIHTLTRNRQLIDQLARLGLCISYCRVVQLERKLAVAMCRQFNKEQIVCPLMLRRGLYTIGALDNLDHNPSSTTAKGSFHGSAISVIQFPTQANLGQIRVSHCFLPADPNETPELLDSYSIVESVYLKPSTTSVPKVTMTPADGKLQQSRETEEKWIQHASKLLDSVPLEKGDVISWAAYHASQQPTELDPPALIALLPLFQEKADSPAMIKHAMNVLKTTTEYLNPGQIPVLACDCPIFANCKYVQWTWPETHGEDKFVIMFGGFHIEKALWTAFGDMLDQSGWTAALTDSGVASSGTANSFIKAAHVTRTRHAHQVTALALSHLQKQAFDEFAGEGGSEDMEKWRQNMCSKSPTFQFWDLVLRTEILILIFIRAHRERDFSLFLESLQSLMFLFFALDHYNYCRWVSIHVRDMQALPDAAAEDIKRNWTVNKTQRRFSALPIDQVHEQENAKVKGKGGAIGLTENREAFQRWMLAGPEQARLLTEFEREYLSDNDVEDPLHCKHHEESFAAQESFKSDTNSLIATIRDYGNPFKEEHGDLLVLNSRDCVDQSIAKSMQCIEAVGHNQYQSFKQEVFVDKTRSIQSPIKKNSVPLFKTPKKSKRRPKSAEKIASLQSDVSLFGRMYIANQLREGNPEVFFSHENQAFPPTISNSGRLRLTSSKSKLLTCLDTSGQQDAPAQVDCKIFDGAAIVHGLPVTTASTFDDYARKIFEPFLIRELQGTKRLDLVWDRYLTSSIKDSTRQKRGSGVRRKVAPQTRMPSNWKDFLQDSTNKEELFAFLTQTMAAEECPPDKALYITSGTSVISKGDCESMSECTHEEADTRIVVHLQHAVERGAKKILVRTVDTDVVVILVGQLPSLLLDYPDIDIWVAFGMGKNFCHYNINSICRNLGEDKSRALPLFHAYTGCDTTSCFLGKGKKSAWKVWKSHPDLTQAFLHLVNHPFQEVDSSSAHIRCLERFTILMYDVTSNLISINEARRELFCKKRRNLENIPPTQDSLLQHIKRVVYQGGIWVTCRQAQPPLPNPEGWGWTMDDHEQWAPVWMTIPEAAKACQELIKCNCKSDAGCSGRCKCTKSSLPCTELCSCCCQK